MEKIYVRKLARKMIKHDIRVQGGNRTINKSVKFFWENYR